MFRWIAKNPNKLRLLEAMDGLEIQLPCVCSVCGAHITLVAAGVATSVQEFMMVQQKKWLSVLCQRRWANGMFLVAQFTEERNEKKLEMLQKVFKFESQQVLSKVSAGTGMAETKGKTGDIENLLSQQRPPKRLKISKTQEGADL